MDNIQKASSPKKSNTKDAEVSKKLTELFKRESFEFYCKLLTKMLKKEMKSKQAFSKHDYQEVFKKLRDHSLGIDYAVRADMIIMAVEYFLDAMTLASLQKSKKEIRKLEKNPAFFNAARVMDMLEGEIKYQAMMYEDEVEKLEDEENVKVNENDNE